MASAPQTLRLRRPEPPKPTPPQPSRHTGILQDQLRRAARKPWVPDFQTAVRILLLVRVAGAMYSNIQDCDEVFNFWEPLHFLQHGNGFQTWEVTPTFAIRSWAYILFHMPAARLSSVFALGKRPAFFAVRIFLAVLSTACEVRFFRTVVEKINDRVGRYLFFILLFNAGMWNAATAFLPSSFAMYAMMLAFAFALEPSTIKNSARTLYATMLFATGAIVGWPFALALSLPFVFEELFVLSGDKVDPASYANWMLVRWRRLVLVGLVSTLIFVPVICIDSVTYGKWTIVPWNIVRYNIFGGSERGPDLYGTSPWYFYILNLLLNFNLLLALALASLPSLAITYYVDRKRLGSLKPGPNESSPFTILALRLTPLYLWLLILTAQPHKEERFVFPAYPLICFNAAVTIYLLRGWLEVAYIHVTKSPYRASKSIVFSATTLSIIVISGLLSVSRILALWHYYHAPLAIFARLEAFELPRLLNDTGLLPLPPATIEESDRPSINFTILEPFGLKLCLAKEWHRFPGHYLVPDTVSVDFVKSDFEGLLPAHFRTGNVKGEPWWDRKGSRSTPAGLNDINKEVYEYYVHVETCDYLVDLDFPLHPTFSRHEPRYAIDQQTWERVECLRFLDASHSSLVTRTLWVPGRWWQSKNEYGDYCLLRNRERVAMKEHDFITRTRESSTIYNMLVHETSGKRTVDMVSSSIHTRLTRTSSDLRILSAVLLPPSPILKPDDLLISSTSGEIPILLEARTHACNAPLTLSEPPEFWNLGKLSTTGNMRNLTRHDEALREHWMHVESDELCYITAELQNDCHAQSPGDFLPAGAVPGDLKNAPHPAYYGFLGGDSRRPGKQDDCSLPILGLGQGDFEGSRDPQASYPSTTALTSTTVVPKDLDGGQLPMIATFHTYSTLPTPTFAPPSPSPSADVISLSSSPTSWRHRRPLERARAVRFPGRARSPRLQVNEVEAHLMRNAPPSPTKDAYPRWQLADPTLMTSGYAYTTETVRLFPKHVALPEGLSWLKHMAIELWIDQEGFRSVRPCMQLIGYSPRTRSLHPYESAENVGSDITAGVAEFMPIKRETFTFHYATLDSPPTLRMVSVVGDESRDYTSRQATLSVKLNGVYTVLGTETFMASAPDYDAHGSRLQNVIQRLRWKFDYLVSDRKVDGTGKALTGEKTLTPLTFSCSPYLFHPLQGKKAGLMHTMRKNLVPKLGSQRLEPPSPASSRGILPRSCRHLESGREPVATHARSHSDAFARGGRRLHTRSQLDNGVGGEAKGMDRVQRARRRRASSAGEESSTCLRSNEPRQGRTVPPREGMFMQTSPTLF